MGGSTLLTTLVTTDPMYVYFDVDERTMLRSRARRQVSGKTADASAAVRQLEAPVEIGLADTRGYSHTGKLDFIDNRVDPTTGTIQVRGVFDNADKTLTAGMFVRVRVAIQPRPGALLISERAIGTDQSSKYVLVVNDQSVVEYRPVTLGVQSEGLRVIESGLQPGDRVITSGVQRARPGIRVTPSAAEGGAPARTGATKEH